MNLTGIQPQTGFYSNNKENISASSKPSKKTATSGTTGLW